MKALTGIFAIYLALLSSQSFALSLAPEEFKASRKLTCVLAQQSLGQLSENEYGEQANSLLDGFSDSERDNILAQAVGYYGGLVFSSSNENEKNVVAPRLKDFLSSSTCSDNYRQVTLQL
tara:strand:+ start:769 stop:1128 length:360 start_codon:yes stop_codon:yes gene_type:complete